MQRILQPACCSTRTHQRQAVQVQRVRWVEQRAGRVERVGEVLHSRKAVVEAAMS